MRTHAEIVRAIPNLAPFATRRGVSVHTARSWIQRDSIPAEHWKAIADEKFASLEELAEAAAVSGKPPREANEAGSKWDRFPVLDKTSSGRVVTSALVRRLSEDEA